MGERIKLTEDTTIFEEDAIVWKFNLIDEPLKQQILDDYNWREVFTAYYWLQEILKNGTNWYDEIKKEAEKWSKHEDNLKKLGLDEKMDLQIHEAFVDEFKRLNKIEEDNKQLKKQGYEMGENNKKIIDKLTGFLQEAKQERDNHKQKLEDIHEWMMLNRGTYTCDWSKLEKILSEGKE